MNEEVSEEQEFTEATGSHATRAMDSKRNSKAPSNFGSKKDSKAVSKMDSKMDANLARDPSMDEITSDDPKSANLALSFLNKTSAQMNIA